MQCSARKFLASQALYGAQIAHPDWSHAQLVAEAVALSAQLIRKLDRERRTRSLPGGAAAPPYPPAEKSKRKQPR